MGTKKILIGLCALSLCFTGCGKFGGDEETTTTLPVKVVAEALQTTTTTTAVSQTVMEELSNYQLTDNALLDISNNVDDTIDLSLVCVNNSWLSIKDLNLNNFLNGSKLKKCSWSTISNNDEKLYFMGNGYGFVDIPEDDYRNTNFVVDDPTAFKGTLLGIECSLDSEAVEIIDETNIQQYNIKAVMSSAENTKDDFEVLYYNGVKTGMTREEVVSLLGEGIVTNEVTTTTTPTTTTASSTEVLVPETITGTETITSGVSVPTVTTTPVSTAEPLVTTAVPTVSSTEPVPETSVIEETISEAKAEASEEIESETVKTDEDEPSETTDSAEKKNDKKSKKEEAESETEEVTTTTTVPETVTEITTTTTTDVDPYEHYTANMYFKNTQNTLVLIFDDGRVSQIFLYNNASEKAVPKPVIQE